MPPLVSVIIPAYNHEAFVGEAIASVLAQSLEDFELIVIDDGSTDATREKIKAFTDPRLTFLAQENRGAAATLNRGLELARGRYISILNSDDRYHPERLARLCMVLNNDPGKILAASSINVVDAAGQRVEAEWLERGLKFFREKGNLRAAIIRDNFICTTSNIFCHRELFDKIGFFRPLRYCHDLDFILKAQSVGEIFFGDEVLLDYRVHTSNTIKEISAVGGDQFKLEVAGVIAQSLAAEKLPLNEFPGFIAGLQDTQLGQLLDLVGLFCCFIESSWSENQELTWLQETSNSTLRDELLAFISRCHQKQAAPWKLYRDALDKYNEKLELVQLLNSSCADYQNEINELNHEADKLRETLSEQQRSLDILQWKLNNKEAILNEIYRSKGWQWLTQYRQFSGRLRRLGKRVNNFIPQRFPLHFNQKETTGNSEKPVFAAYEIRIANPLQRVRPRVVHAIGNVMVGGSTQLVVDIYERLGHKYDQMVATMYRPEQEAYIGLPVIDFSDLRNAHQFADFLKKQQAAILHVHYWGECDNEWYDKIFRATEIYHCSVVENINIPVAAYLHPQVNRYVFVSHYITNYTEKIPNNFQVVYPGSHLQEFDRQETRIPDDVIGMVYRLEPDKLNEASIEVFIEVVKRRPETRVIIVGGGSLLKVYQQRVREANLEKSFEFTGYVAYRELPKIYRRLSIFVAPVWRESFGQVSTFAMNVELPVVGFQVAGGVQEMIGCKDCFAPDIDSLATLIVELLNDRERRLELGRANRKRAQKLFSVEAMIDQYDQVYQQLLTSGNILGENKSGDSG